MRLTLPTSPGATRRSKARQAAFSTLRLADLAPNPRNPRKHSPAQIRAIARSIQAFGFNAPILIDRNSQIVAGHGRYEAAKQLGLKQVSVVRLDHLSEAQAKAYMLADNKLTDRSSWNDQLLAQQLNELAELALDFDMEATGFELPEVDALIHSLDDLDGSGEDSVAPAEGPATTQPGDLWHLGAHRLLCGSALDAASYSMLLGATRAAAVFTDPPYNVAINGHVSGSGATPQSELAMAAGEMSATEVTTFLQSFLAVTVARLDEGGILFHCMDWRHLEELFAAAKANKLDLVNLCVWVKPNGGMGSLYRSQHELVCVFRCAGKRHRNNVQLGRHGRNRTNVWHYEGTSSFPSARKGNARHLHPTMKPIGLVADALLDVTRRGDVVLDPFMGSGTTILAAERTGRSAHGIELDPLYVDTAIMRWQMLTGKQAQLASGQTFVEVTKARGLA